MLLGKFSLCHVTGIGLAENGVTVTWNDLTGIESRPQVVLDGLITEIITNSSLHLCEPVQDFLVGEAVKRTSKTVQTSSKGQHWGTESRSNQVSSVSRNVTTLVISMDGEIQSHQFNEILVLAKSELVGEVEGVILVLLDSSDLAALEDVLVDSSGDSWELGNQIHGILESVTPVLVLLHSLSISLGECGLVLESSDSEGELCHWVKIAWASVDELFDELWYVGTSGPLGREIANLLLAGNFTGQKEPEKT